jgi:hypothetical protein
MSAPARPPAERTQVILLRQRATSAASDVQRFGPPGAAGAGTPADADVDVDV